MRKLILFLLTAQALAIYNGAAAQDLKDRKIVVILEQPLPKMLSSLNEEEVRIYQQEIEEYNVEIKSAFESHFTSSVPVEFRSREEASALRKSKDKGFAIVEYSKFSQGYLSRVAFQLIQNNKIAREQTRLSGAITKSGLYSHLELWLAEQAETSRPKVMVSLPDPFPGKPELVYAVRQLDASIKKLERNVSPKEARAMEKQIAKRLLTKTLLISERDVENSSDKDVLLKAYNLAAEVVPQSKIDEVIISANPAYAYVYTIPIFDPSSDRCYFEFQAIDAESGETIVSSKEQESGPNGILVETRTIRALRELKEVATESKIPPINKENLKDFARAAKK